MGPNRFAFDILAQCACKLSQTQASMNASVTRAFPQSNREDPRTGSFKHQTFTRDGNMQTPVLRLSPCAPPRAPLSNQAALILCIPVLPPTPPLPIGPADPLARVRSSLHLLSSTSMCPKRERNRSHTETKQTITYGRKLEKCDHTSSRLTQER